MSQKPSFATVLIVDSEIILRHALAEYLQHCGYTVAEAADTDEAMLALYETSLSIDVILCDVAVKGTRTGFEFVSYVRQQYPDLEVKLAGSIEAAADTAADLCSSGPDLARPYEPQAVVDYVKQLRAARARAVIPRAPA